VFEPIGIDGVSRFAGAPDAPHPRLAIVGALHGNEPCGLRAIERLQYELRTGQLRLRAGTLYLVHGNPPASEQQERHTRGGLDLNRLFDYRFVNDIPSAHWVYEHNRALELRPILDSVDALLDLHSTTAPSPAFAIASPLPGSRALADGLGLAYVTQGWESPGLLGDRVVIAPVTERGRPGVSVECGQHTQPESVEVAYACALRCLQYLGMIDADSERARAGAPASTRLWLRAAIKRPSPTFRFVRPLASMQVLEAGDVIGCDDDLVLCAQRRCYVIMPNDAVPVGEDMLYIAQLRQPTDEVPATKPATASVLDGAGQQVVERAPIVGARVAADRRREP